MPDLVTGLGEQDQAIRASQSGHGAGSSRKPQPQATVRAWAAEGAPARLAWQQPAL